MAEGNLLDMETVTEPFDLKTALGYMTEHGEFIKGEQDARSFYMYSTTQKRPTIVDGKRKMIEITKVYAFDMYGQNLINLNVANLLDKQFTIMEFDESGAPIWTK